MNRPTLVIGNYNYSSWSLRAWLVLRHGGVHFDTLRLPLDTPEFERRIGEYSPTRRVPVLHHDGLVVWDSLAIAEYVNDALAGGALWPGDPAARAHARSASAEMHSGFATLRARLPMNCRGRRRISRDVALDREIGRVEALWRECRARADAGPWLYGSFCIADAMYAPVASRFLTYGIEPSAAAADYMATVLADADYREWLTLGEAESEVIDDEEVGDAVAPAE